MPVITFGRSTYIQVYEFLNVYLNSCLSAVDCTLGCGTLVYLVLTAQPAIFSTYCGTPFLPPKNPGIHPVIPGPAPTTAIFSELFRTHKHEVCLFDKYNAFDQTCKKFISQLIPEKLYKSLSSRIIGFPKVTCLQILNHLIIKYAELEDDYIQEINQRMKQPILRETIFEELIEKIEWNQEAVAVQNLYMLAHTVSMAFSNIKKCGLYQDNCREWSYKQRLEKMWSNFKARLVSVFKETQRPPRTSKNECYAANVQSAQANVALFEEMQQDHTMALANIATATQANRKLVVLLTKTITELTTQVTYLTTKLLMAQSENDCLKKSGHCLANTGAPSDLTLICDQNIYAKSGTKFEPNKYCSSHSYKIEETHNSATCIYLIDGHNKLATLLDTKGGRIRNKDCINSRQTK